MKIEQRERFLDRSLDKYFDCMDRDSNHERFQEFCENLGYGAVAAFLSDSSNFVVLAPEGSVDTATLPNAAIPVVGLGVEDEVDVEASVHPLQLASSSFSFPITRKLLPAGPHAVASIWAPTLQVKDRAANTVLVQSYHPFFTVNVDVGYRRKDLVCPTVIGHEITHLAQVLARPYVEYDLGYYKQHDALDHLQNEVEACSYQDSLFERFLVDMGRVSSMPLANSVEPIRKRTMGASYKINDAFIERASNDAFASRIVPDILSPKAIAAV